MPLDNIDWSKMTVDYAYDVVHERICSIDDLQIALEAVQSGGEADEPIQRAVVTHFSTALRRELGDIFGLLALLKPPANPTPPAKPKGPAPRPVH